MVRSIVFAEREYGALQDHLFSDTEREQAAFLLAAPVERPSLLKLLVREVLPLTGEDFVEHGAARLVIEPRALAWAMKRAAGEEASLILVHTHPGATDAVAFSPVDDEGEPAIFANVARRIPGRPHASMVFGRRAVAARLWRNGAAEPVDRIVVVGPRLRVVALERPTTFDGDRYDRQVRAFGAAGQRDVAGLTVGLVGCGGTGSAVAEQLLRLGVGQVLAIDPDTIEESNVTRVYGSTADDAARAVPKVAIVARLAAALGRPGAVEAIRGDVRDGDVAARLAAADVLFGCTDSHWSRLVLNRLAEQYLIPLIDLGTRIDAREGRARSVAGRVSVLLPGTPCLFCAGVIRPEIVAAESLPAEERRGLAAEGYVIGLEDLAPAVIALNTVTAGLAATAFLGMVAGFVTGPGAAHLTYTAHDGNLRAATFAADPQCWCRTGEGYARGDADPLPGVRGAQRHSTCH